MNENGSDMAKTLLDAGTALAKPIDVTSPTQVILVPEGHTTQSAEAVVQQFLPHPRRIKINIQFSTVESFTRYINDFKNSETRIFARATGLTPPPYFVAIIDYHNAASPQWCEHRATYAPQITEEWKRWMDMNKKTFTQSEFATFLEENEDLVVNPPGAALLELVQDLEAHAEIRCNQAVRLQNGTVRVAYDENVTIKGNETTQAGNITFPSELLVALPLFDPELAYKVRCRLRYRISDRRLSFFFEAVDVHLIVRDAVKDIVAQISESTSIVPLFGAI